MIDFIQSPLFISMRRLQMVASTVSAFNTPSYRHH
ncbi:unnamed protein product [Haemonchus placei]|uniref:Uncharacterized protein n=1 Tax=Haemonchus placei TaxID=6290 RepID=A0A3P7YMF3_HAEPC|nr:unnamed protein product [Haemonchus placei]